jgi:hypothetical protein
MFCYVKQVYEYYACESAFIRGHQFSWFQQNTLIHTRKYFLRKQTNKQQF